MNMLDKKISNHLHRLIQSTLNQNREIIFKEMKKEMDFVNKSNEFNYDYKEGFNEAMRDLELILELNK